MTVLNFEWTSAYTIDLSIISSEIPIAKICKIIAGISELLKAFEVQNEKITATNIKIFKVKIIIFFLFLIKTNPKSFKLLLSILIFTNKGIKARNNNIGTENITIVSNRPDIESTEVDILPFIILEDINIQAIIPINGKIIYADNFNRK